jgi:hypothetical protein
MSPQNQSCYDAMYPQNQWYYGAMSLQKDVENEMWALKQEVHILEQSGGLYSSEML